MRLQCFFLIGLFFSSCAHAARIPEPQHKFHIFPYASSEHGSIKNLVISHLFNLGYNPHTLLIPYDKSFGWGAGGSVVYLSDSHAEELRQYLSSHGLRLDAEPRVLDNAVDEYDEVNSLLKGGNAIIQQHARRILDFSEHSAPWIMRHDLEADEAAWSRNFDLVYQKAPGGLMNQQLRHCGAAVRQELSVLHSAVRTLAQLSHENLAKDLTQRGNMPQARNRGQSEYFYGLPGERLSKEVRIQFIESHLDSWLVALQSHESIGMNLETYEVLAHGFMMTLTELESGFVERTHLVTQSDIVDVLNRRLVGALWFQSPEICGPRCLELVDKLLTYDGLVPYLRLALAARIGSEYNIPPNEQDLANYDRLEDTLSFIRAHWGEMLLPHIVHGNISSRRPGELRAMQVDRGLQSIDQWLAKHRMPTKDWQTAQGVPLGTQRDRLLEKRSRETCGPQLVGHPRSPRKPRRRY